MQRVFKIAVNGTNYDVVVEELTSATSAIMPNYLAASAAASATQAPMAAPVASAAVPAPAGAGDQCAQMGGVVAGVMVKEGQRVAQVGENTGHIGKGRKAHILVAAKMDGLADQGRAGCDTIRIGFGQKRKAGIPARLTDREVRKMLQDLRIFQQLQCS